MNDTTMALYSDIVIIHTFYNIFYHRRLHWGNVQLYRIICLFPWVTQNIPNWNDGKWMKERQVVDVVLVAKIQCILNSAALVLTKVTTIVDSTQLHTIPDYGWCKLCTTTTVHVYNWMCEPKKKKPILKNIIIILFSIESIIFFRFYTQKSIVNSI